MSKFRSHAGLRFRVPSRDGKYVYKRTISQALELALEEAMRFGACEIDVFAKSSSAGQFWTGTPGLGAVQKITIAVDDSAR